MGTAETGAENVVERLSTASDDRSELLLLCEEEVELRATLLEAIGVGVLAHTLDGRVVYANEIACSLLGLPRGDFDSLPDWAWVPPATRSLVPERMRAIVGPGGAVFAGNGVPHDDGRTRHTEIHARVCENARHGRIVVSAIHDVTERVAVEERIRHLAYHDSLTDLPNRKYLLDRMATALYEADRHGDIVGVVFVDLDDFKPVNDTMGHPIGDEVLKIIAERLRACTRDTDTIARMGGDEFLALFPRLDSPEALASIAASIAGCISVPIQIAGRQVEVTASVGLALYREGEATDELITRADHAMYRAKQDGLSGWEEFLAELREDGPAT